MKDLHDILSLMETGQLDAAEALVESFLKTASDEEKFIIIEMYSDWGFIEDAIEILNPLLKKYPNEGQLLTKLAELYIELEEDDKAIDLLQNIDRDDGFYIHALLLLADTYERQGLFEVAEQKLFEAKDHVSDEDAFIIDFAIAELLLSLGEAQRAIVFYEKLSKDLDDVNGVFIFERLAESHMQLGNFEKALQYYEELDDKDPNILFKQGFAAYRAGDIKQAIKIWKEIIEIDPHYHPVYYELATAYDESDQVKEAYEIAKEGLLYDEFDKRLYFIKGKTALALGEKESSIKALEEAIALDEDYKEAILLLASIYEEDNDIEAMIDFLQGIKQLGATDPLYDWQIARGYNELEAYDKAKEVYQEAYFYLADDSDFLKEYGFFLVEDGDIQEGSNILRKYIEFNQDDIDTISFLERIQLNNDNEM